MSHKKQVNEIASECGGMTRRHLLMSLAAGASSLSGQGVSSRGVQPVPRGKPSGLPFLAQFRDVGEQAGLHFPTIYGGPGKKENVLEGVGCGVAFFDFDNDGWLDIFTLCGTDSGDKPTEASNRLYKNNRDGTFADITAKAGLIRTGWASSVTAGTITTTVLRTCSSLTTARMCSTAITAMAPLPMSP